MWSWPKIYPFLWFSLYSDKQANTLVHCGAICKTESSCAGFTFKDKVCGLVDMASVDENGEEDDSSEKVYIDTTLEGIEGRFYS